MSGKMITTRDIANLMLGRELTTREVIELVESNYPDYAISRRAISNRIINLSNSKNAEMRTIGDGKIKTWLLLSVSDVYFRKSSATRGGVTPKQTPKASGRIYTRTRITLNDSRAMAFLQVYQLADRLMRAARTHFINQSSGGELHG